MKDYVCDQHTKSGMGVLNGFLAAISNKPDFLRELRTSLLHVDVLIFLTLPVVLSQNLVFQNGVTDVKLRMSLA
jgi:hypothetical protein